MDYCLLLGMCGFSSFTLDEFFNFFGNAIGILILLALGIIAFLFFAYCYSSFKKWNAKRKRLKEGEAWARQNLIDKGIDPDLDKKFKKRK